VFERVLQSCIDAGLVGGEGFAVDASVVKADANRQRYRNADDDWGSGPGVRDYFDGLQEDDPTPVADLRTGFFNKIDPERNISRLQILKLDSIIGFSGTTDYS